ncbi:phycobiliprotein lyase [Pseudanabaena mucicola]|uniref:Chromophore lyase CpcS/CpeS n=1 Tax=Pseudanabaena mucicola FACHB-723 TaxID=2692860 RepID=A0ABR7ZWR1_9CYAN|nr:phycobiliprotein lyase [Pseudanabaena mucicola]MBD2188200.1 phycobiliprotein lyase [Pseudanabaena mucicola FACHB-723]
MDIQQFLELFVGRWRSQRSDHQFGEGNGSDILSVLEITALSLDNPSVVEMCQKHSIDPSSAFQPMQMSWEEESLSSNKPKGSAIVVPVVHSPQKGLIITNQGKGICEIAEDESLTIQTVTTENVIEERIWYGNPNLRFRVATVLQGNQSGDLKILSSKFYSEIRVAAPKP